MAFAAGAELDSTRAHLTDGDQRRSMLGDGLENEPEAGVEGALAISRFIALIRHWTGLDRAIAFTVMARSWSAIAGVLTVLLIARFLTPSEQGYYYTFSSLVALQIVFELGFSFVVLQLTAHECTHLVFMSDGQLKGDPIAHSRIASVLQKSVRWYTVGALLMIAMVLPAGISFFSANQHAAPVVEWKIPWCMAVSAAAITFQIDPVFSFLEGCGFVSQVARMRLGQAMLGSTLAWAAIASHHGLFAPAMVIFGQAMVGLVFLLSTKRRRFLRGLLLHSVGQHQVGWRHEIWPFQWKIALSTLSGYFIFQIVNPMLFAYQGPVVAGRMGMSLGISTALLSLAMAWMNTKAAPFGSLVARRDFQSLDKLFFRTLWQSSAILVTAAGLLFACLLVGSQVYPKLATRVLQPWAFALILLTAVVNQIIFSEALYLRSHKREPFLVCSVTGAFLSCVLMWALGKYFGADLVALGNFLCAVLVGLPWGTYIFISKRRQWHGRGSSAPAECNMDVWKRRVS